MEPFSSFMLAFAIVPVVLDTVGLIASFKDQTNLRPAVAVRLARLKVSSSGVGLHRRLGHDYAHRASLVPS